MGNMHTDVRVKRVKEKVSKKFSNRLHFFVCSDVNFVSTCLTGTILDI